MSLNRRAMRALNNSRVIIETHMYPRRTKNEARKALTVMQEMYRRIPDTPAYSKPFDRVYWRAYQVRTGRAPWRAIQKTDRWRREKALGEHVAWRRAEWHRASRA